MTADIIGVDEKLFAKANNSSVEMSAEESDRFLKEMENFRVTNKKGTYVADFPEKCFPSAWIGSSVPVIFDFKGTDEIKYAYDLRYPLYCLYPKSSIHGYVVVITSREKFIDGLISGDLHK